MKNKKTDLQLEKDKIRKEILGKRNNLSIEEVEKKSDLIIENLEKFIKNAENIMIFMDMKNEVRITKLMEFYPKKSFFIPKIQNGIHTTNHTITQFIGKNPSIMCIE